MPLGPCGRLLAIGHSPVKRLPLTPKRPAVGGPHHNGVRQETTQHFPWALTSMSPPLGRSLWMLIMR